MQFTVVINMRNPNALIAMAFVSQNSNNPYSVFCEYIKYCIFSDTADAMSISDIRTSVSKEFGLYIPYNIAVKCLSIIENEGMIELSDHQVKRTGSFDTDAFDHERDAYRKTETALIQALISYVSQYGLSWPFEYAREQLIKVLDKNGLAYDIFIHGKPDSSCGTQPAICVEELNELLPDEDAVEDDNVDSQPLYSDSLFVGRFIDQVLLEDGAYKDYVLRICEGLMLCVGAYQLPSADAQAAAPQIRNAGFFFDTRLLLRFVGCAGEAAVEAANELVKLIQSKGGNIYYHPQTLEEMNRAFDEAICSLSYNDSPRDEEMRLYAVRAKNSVAVLRAKKANLEKELASANIHIRHHETFTDAERMRFGFDRMDLQKYMESKLRWDSRTIENDAYSLWETHMRRQGDYSEYCGSRQQLPVFVTTNSRLIGVAIAYRDARPSAKGIYGWKQNRLPVITDIRLTCRLWIPSEQSSRLSLLHLTANAVAAQRPTRRYLNTVRELAVELEKTVPEYSGIPLSAFFEDNVTDALLTKTMGDEEKLNLGSFASSLAELSEWKAREQEEITNRVRAERDEKNAEFDQQTASIIRGAVDSNKGKLGFVGLLLRMILWWPAIVALLFAGIGSVLSWTIGNWSVVWIALLPIAAKGLEMLFASKIAEKTMLKWYIPKAEATFSKRIERNLRQAEQPYKEIIMRQVKEETSLWAKCQSILNSK